MEITVPAVNYSLKLENTEAGQEALAYMGSATFFLRSPFKNLFP